MSEVMQQGILRMPPECWMNGQPLDEQQRHSAYVSAADRILALERENAALREDQERLDWLTNSLGWVIVGYPEADPSNHATEDNTLADAWRAAIDAARKEAKP